MLKPKYRIYRRKLITYNSDPQRRCYNGCHAKTDTYYDNWFHIGTVFSKEDAEASIASWKSICPQNKYKYKITHKY